MYIRMELLGAKVHPVTSGTMTLKDAVNEAMREWTNTNGRYIICIGLCYGTIILSLQLSEISRK